MKAQTVKAIPPAWDSWALGVVLAFATLGRHPYWTELGKRSTCGDVCMMMVTCSADRQSINTAPSLSEYDYDMNTPEPTNTDMNTIMHNNLFVKVRA